MKTFHLIVSILWGICGSIGIAEIILYKICKRKMNRNEPLSRFQHHFMNRIHSKLDRYLSKLCYLLGILWYILLFYLWIFSK